MDDVSWICNDCGSKENVRGATMAVGPVHICFAESENPMTDVTPEILTARIEARNEKIKNVEEKIERQKLHVAAINKNKKSLRGHLSKWKNQNKKDTAKLEEFTRLAMTDSTATQEIN